MKMCIVPLRGSAHSAVRTTPAADSKGCGGRSVGVSLPASWAAFSAAAARAAADVPAPASSAERALTTAVWPPGSWRRMAA